MKLLYLLFNSLGEILLCKDANGFSIPFSGEEVDAGYGFDSPEKDNNWFLENCGLKVFRRYVCFYHDYCIAVFDLQEANGALESQRKGISTILRMGICCC